MTPTFINIGDRTSVTGSAEFRNLIVEGDYTAVPGIARVPVSISMNEGEDIFRHHTREYLKHSAAEVS